MNKLIFSTLFLSVIISIVNSKLIVVKQWQNSDCTGNFHEFLAFSENNLYSEIMESFISCDDNKCQVNVKDGKILIWEKDVKCNKGGKTLEFIENDEFVYDKSKFNVISEYSNNLCQFKPIFNMGILNNACVYGWLTKRVDNGYQVEHCKSNDYANPINYTVTPNNIVESFPHWSCKESMFDSKSKSRGYLVHQSSLDASNFMGPIFGDSGIDNSLAYSISYSVTLILFVTISLISFFI